jgi:isopentenyl diphosphate isomerase/L-lactate dehydrogenase-like FMN-dependent dehydrogenase
MAPGQWATFQPDLYLKAIAGEAPPHPLRPDELEAAARAMLPTEVYEYVVGGAGVERTVAANRRAFERWRFAPRHLVRDVSRRDLSVELFGRRLPAPVLLAPVGVLGSFRPDGELTVAGVLAELGIGWVVPTLSSVPLEAVAEAMGDAPRWFQLYWSRDPDVTASHVGRAEAAGYDAIVLTIDTQVPGWRPRDLMHGYHPLLGGHGIANFAGDPAFRAQRSPDADDAYVMYEAAAMLGDPSRTWDAVADLCASTDLPVVVKGIQHPADVAPALDAGVAGIGVSNHGGRQLDNAVGSLDVLPAVVRAVDGAVPVVFDSGIRSGGDVVTALALGADVVLVGRPYVWGLAAGDADGVRQVVRALLAETDVTLGLLGCATLADLGPEVLVAGGVLP